MREAVEQHVNAPRTIKRILMAFGVTFVVVLVGAGAYTTWIVRRGFSAHDEPSSLEAFVARMLRSLSVPTRAQNLKNPLRSTGAVLADGEAHWADHCAFCHANDGSGDTPIGRNLYPKAPDMRRWPTQRLSDGELYYIIQNGVRLTGMPAWGDWRNDRDLSSWALVAFIRRLPKLTKAELREMKSLNPKSAHELREQHEEDEFLKGDSDFPSHDGEHE